MRKIKHLFLGGLDAATAEGGAGGNGRGTLTAASTGSATEAAIGAGMGSAVVMGGFSSAGGTTLAAELWRAMRGSLREMLTEETGGLTRGGFGAGGAMMFGSS